MEKAERYFCADIQNYGEAVMGILKGLVREDFGVTGSGRWWRAVDHDSLVIDDQKDVFYWNSEGIAGDALEYLIRVRGMNYYSAKEYLKSVAPFSTIFSVDINTERNNQEIFINPKLVDIFHEYCLERDTSYWDVRGINEKSIRAFKLGFTGKYFTIPLYEKGVFKNFQLRKDNPKEIRMFYKTGTSFLFNTEILDLMRIDTLYITEGPTDCIRLFQEGFQCISSTSGAEGWKSEWNIYLDGIKRIVIVYDNDSAGLNGALRLAKNLGLERCKIYNFFGFDEKEDVISFFNKGYSSDDFLRLVIAEAKHPSEIEGILKAKRYLTKHK